MSERPDLSRCWDVAIVGTGMGGATVGRELARRGLSVLFLERGTGIPASAGQGAGPPDADERQRLAAGWWPTPFSQRLAEGRYHRFLASVGCALGGGSIHYAAALERMAASDFDTLQTSSGMVSWPVSFADFVPHYEAAETLFRVQSDPDAAERRFSEQDRALMALLRQHGLKPEPLHVAMRYDEPCQECINVVCPRGCKADARTVCLDEALRQRDCAVLDECEVLSLDSDRSRVKGIRARHHGRDVEVRARVVVLSAGAWHSPQILLRSANEHWSRGLANSSDQVGRNLMFHTVDLYAVFGPRRLARTARQKKSISLRDFYFHEGRRLGYIQSLGLEAGAGSIAAYLKEQLRLKGVRHELLLSALVKLPSLVFARALGNATLYVGMTEDDPAPENRIFLDPKEPDGAGFSYTITDDLRARANALYEHFARNVRPWRLFRVSRDLAMNHGHPCGTCRSGEDRSTSVLDRNCRAHDVENLYVVDASFMPRSGAVNPSLTIAANALRVAPHIAAAAIDGRSAPSESAV